MAVTTAKPAMLTNKATRILICVMRERLSTVPNSPKIAGMTMVVARPKLTSSQIIIRNTAEEYTNAKRQRSNINGRLMICLCKNRMNRQVFVFLIVSFLVSTGGYCIFNHLYFQLLAVEANSHLNDSPMPVKTTTDMAKRIK